MGDLILKKITLKNSYPYMIMTILFLFCLLETGIVFAGQTKACMFLICTGCIREMYFS